MILDRTISPVAKPIAQLNILEMQNRPLKNGTPLKVLNHGGAELIQFEFLFKGGSRFQEQPLVANFTNLLLLEGCEKYNSKEINDKLDFYGAFYNTEVLKDYASLKVYTLKKYLNEVLEIIQSCITTPTFPEEEFNILLNNKKANFQVQSGKVDFICRQTFSAKLYEGGDYGKTAEMEDYDNLTLDQLKSFYQTYYKKGYQILLAGAIDDNTIQSFEDAFGGLEYSPLETEKTFSLGTPGTGKVFVEKEGAIQSAIRMGRNLIDMDHPDFTKMKFVSTLLGGYFGSRLMTNIREDKGYTYGIGSAVMSYEKAGLFLIASEVGGDVCQAAIDEIDVELNRLRTEKVHEEEIKLVRNYMLGSFMRSLDGPFDLLEAYKQIMYAEKGYAYYNDLLHTINTIDANTIQEIANKYLKREDLLEVVAGKL